MSNVHSGLALQALGCVASRVGRKLLRAAAEKFNAPPVPNAHKQVQIQGERLGTGKDTAEAPVLIPKFDLIRSVADDLA